MKRQILPTDSPVDLLRILKEQKERDLYSIRSKSYKKYEYIYSLGQTTDEIYVIKEGRIKIVNDSPKDRTIIKEVFVGGDLFGGVALAEEASRFDSAVAMEKTELYILTLDVLYQQMEYHSSLVAYLVNLLGTRIRRAERRIESFAFKTSRTRIIDFLGELAERRGQKIGYEILVRSFFTHQEIANIVSTSRQSVTTVLNELRNKNILIFDRRRLLIRDLNLLRAEAS